MENINFKEIQCIVPKYVKSIGDCTIIYTDLDEYLVKKQISTVITNLCRKRGIDLKASNSFYGQILGVKKNPPIPFSVDDIYIHVKTRVPVLKTDRAHGYINLKALDKVIKNKEDSYPRILLKNGLELEILTNKKTLDAHIQNGKLVRHMKKMELNNYLFRDLESDELEIDGNGMVDARILGKILGEFFKEVMSVVKYLD